MLYGIPPPAIKDATCIWITVKKEMPRLWGCHHYSYNCTGWIFKKNQAGIIWSGRFVHRSVDGLIKECRLVRERYSVYVQLATLNHLTPLKQNGYLATWWAARTTWKQIRKTNPPLPKNSFHLGQWVPFNASYCDQKCCKINVLSNTEAAPALAKLKQFWMKLGQFPVQITHTSAYSQLV